MLHYLPLHAPQHHYTLLVPSTINDALQASDIRWPDVTIMARTLPPIPRQMAKLWWEQMTMPVAARQLDADVLWTPYWAAPYWQPCPVVVTIHDLIPRLLPAYRGGRMQRLYTSLVSTSARRANGVITVSHASARDIVAHLKIPGSRVHVVHHGPNLADSGPPSETIVADVRARYDLPTRFFLYLGGFDARKNVRGILQAYRIYLDRGGDPAVRLVVAGKLPEIDRGFAPDPKKITAEMGLIDQVHFCGWVAEADKPVLNRLATAFLFPSYYEGFGMMVLEAMQAGTPVITSANS